MNKTTLIIDVDLNKLMAAVGALRVIQRRAPGPYRLVGIGGGAVLVALLLSGRNEDLEECLQNLNYSDHGLLHPDKLRNWLKFQAKPIPLNDLNNHFFIATNLIDGHPVFLPHDALKWNLADIDMIDAAVYAARPPWLVDETRYFICDGRLCDHETIELLSAERTIRIFSEIDPSTPLHGLGTSSFSASVQAGQHAQAMRSKLSYKVSSRLWNEMIVIHTEICPTQSRLSAPELARLYQKGATAAREWFAEDI
jgi:hypothetical protein